MCVPTSVLLVFCWFSWVEPDQAASHPCLLQRSSVSLTTTIASYSLGSQTFPWLQIDQWWITLRCEALFTLNIRVCVFLCSLLSNANVKYEHHYRLQRSWGKVIFSQASVILFTGRGLPQCMLGYHTSPQDQAPPQTRHPLAQSMLGDTVNARAVCILLECNLVICCHRTILEVWPKGKRRR